MIRTTDDLKRYCTRHGDYVAGDRDLFKPCPKCVKVQEKDLCVECERHKATTTFARSAMDHLHGFTQRICTCCYLHLVEVALQDTQENYDRLKKELVEKPCETV